MSVRLPCAVLASVALAVAAAAQPADVRFETPAPGTLSGRPFTAYGALQDHTGFLWTASEEGLARYDGVGFTTFRADLDTPGALPGNRITALAESPPRGSRRGALWACVDRVGLVRFDPLRPRFRRVPTPAALSAECRTVAVGGDGAVWASGGRPSRLYRLGASGGLRAVAVGGTVVRLVTDRRGAVWGLTTAGLHRLDSRAAVRAAGGDWSGGVTDAKGVVWATVAEGAERWLCRLEASGPVRVRDLRALPADASLLLVDRRGAAWFNRTGAGLLVATPGGSVVEMRPRPGRPNGLPDARVTHAVEDREGVLWFATRDGLRKVVPRWEAFQTVALPPSMLGGIVAAVPGGVVVGTLDGALFRFVAGPDTLVPLALAGRPTVVSHVVASTSGGLWLPGWGAGADGGLVRVRPGAAPRRYGPSDAAPALSDAAMRCVLERPDGRVWVGTESGLDLLDPATGRVDRHVALEPVWALAEAPAGRVWIGTYTGGLVLYDPVTRRQRRFRHDADDAETLSSDIVTLVHASRTEPGVWWVGTYDGGLNRLSFERGGRARFRRYTRRDGMPGLAVKSLVEDRRGVLWIGTDAGLVRLAVGTAATGGRDDDLRVLTEADGLPGVEFGLYDAAQLPDGRLAFGVRGDLVLFDPDRVAGSRFDAPVVLRSLRVQGAPRELPPRGGPVRLLPGDGLLSVEAVALSFTAPERVVYAARLDGEPWAALGTDRASSFSHLPPGRHTLRMRAGTASGAWSRRELVVPIVVVPPWWQTLWFRGLAGVVLFGSVGAVFWATTRRRYRARLGRLEAARAAERRLQDERERISRDLHDSVGAQVASLLSGIELARLARRAGPRALEQADPLDTVEDDAHAVMRQLRETIWALHGETVTLDAFRDRLHAYLADRLRGPDCPSGTVTIQGRLDAAFSPLQALGLYRIAQEAVSNAAKHAHAQTLTVALTVGAGQATLTVADDGAFCSPSAGGDGLSGVGLGSMRHRAEALGGTLTLDAGADGTTVRVSVPFNEAVVAPPVASPTGGLTSVL